MRRTVILVVLTITLIVLAGLESYRYAQEHAVRLPTPVRAKAKPAAKTPTPPDACAAACERLRVCEDPQAGPACSAICRNQWSPGVADCVKSATCTQTPACFADVRGPSCDDVCQKVETCGLLKPEENCRTLCDTQWDADARQCMMATACNEIPATCLPAAENEPCVNYCNRLGECGLVDPADQYACIQSCLTIEEPDLRDCVYRVGCDQITAVCLQRNYDPVCVEACERLNRCDALGDLPFEECPAACYQQWDDNTLSCIISRGCNEIGPVCFQQYDPVCENVCGKLVNCQLEDEVEDCLAVCTTDLADEARTCITQTACGDIERLCFGREPNMCDVVCRKAVDCRIDSDYQACYDSCTGSYDLMLIGCILNHSCEQIPQQCLQ